MRQGFFWDLFSFQGSVNTGPFLADIHFCTLGLASQMIADFQLTPPHIPTSVVQELSWCKNYQQKGDSPCFSSLPHIKVSEQYGMNFHVLTLEQSFVLHSTP